MSWLLCSAAVLALIVGLVWRYAPACIGLILLQELFLKENLNRERED